jgi:hypothetical protein
VTAVIKAQAAGPLTMASVSEVTKGLPVLDKAATMALMGK